MSFDKDEKGEIDFTKPVLAGPTTNGFDYYFGVDVPNWPPYSFFENKSLTGDLTETLYKKSSLKGRVEK